MIRAELNKLDQSPRALRSFGLLVGGVAVAFAVAGFWRHRTWWPWFAGPGLLLVLLGAIAPRFLRWIHYAWMTLAFVLGTVVSAVLLTLLFWFAITPIGWIARWSGKDFLRRRPVADGGSYWLSRNHSAQRIRADYERQF